MKPIEYYEGREQTYIKHFFLEKYLERVGFNIGSFTDFVFIDGFSGPWQSQDEEYADTSFKIAIDQLRNVHKGVQRARPFFKLRCLFIEKEANAFKALNNEIDKIDDLDAEAKHGEFENLISEIIEFISDSFSLVFIDPTGWTGYELEKIKPILTLRGEVIINFMYDHINRFIGDRREGIKNSYEELGGPGFLEDVEKCISEGNRREEAILSTYIMRLKSAGNFKHVTSTRILHPTRDRPNFHLIYATRHSKGLLEFRKVEEKTFSEQTLVRNAIRQDRQNQKELFGPESSQLGSQYLTEFREKQLSYAREQLDILINSPARVLYSAILYRLLENEYVWKSDVQELVFDLQRKGRIEIKGLSPRERTLKENHVILRKQ